MRLITNAGLHRGAALIDFAFSKDEDRLDLNASDIIGVVAAYLNRGGYVEDMGKFISERLSHKLANRALDTFRIFEVDTPDRNDGLWFQGPAYDDVRLVHPTLSERFSRVNKRNREVEPTY